MIGSVNNDNKETKEKPIVTVYFALPRDELLYHLMLLKINFAKHT